MNKKFIWAIIIIIMSLALIGIAVTQYVWIKAQVDLDEKNFDDKVYMAMNNVKTLLSDDTKDQESVEKQLKMLQQSNQKTYPSIINQGKDISALTRGLSNVNKNFDQADYQIAGMVSILNPNDHLESVNKEKLDKYLKNELSDQGIDIKYDYGVFSNKEESFIIRNGKFAVSFEGNASSPRDDDANIVYWFDIILFCLYCICNIQTEEGVRDENRLHQ